MILKGEEGGYEEYWPHNSLPVPPLAALVTPVEEEEEEEEEARVGRPHTIPAKPAVPQSLATNDPPSSASTLTPKPDTWESEKRRR
jgi:hypothetical protein